MSALVAAVAAAAEEMRRRSTHTTEVRAEVLSKTAEDRLTRLELQVGQLIAVAKQQDLEVRQLQQALSAMGRVTLDDMIDRRRA